VVLVCEESVCLLWCNWDIFNGEKSYYKTHNGLVGYERAKNEFLKCYTYK